MYDDLDWSYLLKALDAVDFFSGEGAVYKAYRQGLKHFYVS